MAYQDLLKILKEKAALDSVTEVLDWDMETYMPKGQQELRQKQMEVVSAHAHDLVTNDRIGDVLAELVAERHLDAEQQFVVDKTYQDYVRERRVPRELVEAWAKKTTEGYFIWEEARKNNDFVGFAPVLTEIFELAKRIAEKKDPDKAPYSSMLFDYEEDLSLEQVTNTLATVRSGIVPIIKSLSQKELHYLTRAVPVDAQRKFHQYLLSAVNFDFNKGRLDEVAHPMTAAGRITTRYTDKWFDSIGSTIHEAGHAMYEHNLPEEHFGTPQGNYLSMAFHESQSRIWENHVGKNPFFWSAHLAFLKQSYSPALDGMDMITFTEEMHHAAPSLIRIEADELTYPLHVILRFELEQDIMSGKLKISDLPEAWNAKMKDYLGMDVPSNAKGCLQDVHWGSGLIGYFPTYILGSIMSAQLYNAAKRQIPELEHEFSAGNTKPLAEWLKANVHQYGARHDANTLLAMATGNALDPTDYIAHLAERYGNQNS